MRLVRHGGKCNLIGSSGEVMDGEGSWRRHQTTAPSAGHGSSRAVCSALASNDCRYQGDPVMMTRRHLMLLGLTSAAASFAALTPGHASQATGSIQDAGKGTIYVYAWEGGDGKSEIAQGIFALDVERMTWTKVADQSDSKSFDTYFRVSRDGRFLAFARRELSGPPDRVAGISIRDLTRDGEIRKLSAVGFNPFWSSDGKRLMMARGKGEVPGTKMTSTEAWVVNADGSEPRKLPIPETDQVDDWSPDGTWVLTGSHRDKGVGYQIYRMRLDGTEVRRLTATGAGVLNLDGRISPDGRQIAYWRIGDRQSGIWVMDADGTNARRIFDSTTEGVIPGAPSWSPDGQRIVCSIHVERRHEKGYLEMVDHKLVILDLTGGARLRVAPPLMTGLGDPQWARSWKP
jgi:Tol biopolymer transport system component